MCRIFNAEGAIKFSDFTQSTEQLTWNKRIKLALTNLVSRLEVMVRDVAAVIVLLYDDMSRDVKSFMTEQLQAGAGFVLPKCRCLVPHTWD